MGNQKGEVKMVKAILVLAVAIFLFSQVSFAAVPDPSKIAVPRDSGRIVEVYKADKADAPLVVYLQDIHMNYEAQKAEAAVLEALIRDYGFDVVFTEAKEAGTTADFKYLRNANTKEGKIQGAETLLKKGTIAAVNYVDLTTDYNFSIIGAEDMALYKKETEDHTAIFGNNANMVKLMSTMQNIANNLKLHIYTKEMRDLDDKVAAYNKDEIGLIEYVKFLQTQAAANKIDLKTLPNVMLFIDSANLEGQIDFPAVEKERAAAADAIEKALTDKAKKDEFTANGLKFRTGDMSQGAYYTYLKDTAAAAKVDISADKNLTAYTQYITTYEKIDTTVLFKELDTLVSNIKEALIKTPEQKKLNQIDKGLAIISGFVNTKLVPDEYSYYVQNKAIFDLDGWLSFMKDNSAKFALTNPVPDDISVLKTNLPLMERFYAVSFDRDKAFIANIKAGLGKLNKDKAIFIGGGFHTPDMKGLLKENGFSYVVVAPKVDIIRDYGDIYKNRAKIDLEFLNKTMPTAPASSEKKQ